MSSERPTVRPVTLARLVEVTHVCESDPLDDEAIEAALDVSHRRARETILEALRIDLVDEQGTEDDVRYRATAVGDTFLDAIRTERWGDVSSVLQTRSPHYGEFLDVVDEHGPATLDTLLDRLEERSEYESYAFNQTGIEVVGDWGERLGVVQRNAFTGAYYRVDRETVPPNFPFVVLSAFHDLEETAGVNLQQRYISIPRLRETVCERLGIDREAFDVTLQELAKQNVGKLELSGAPTDTGAKDAQYGIKQIALADEGALVSTDQSTDRVMAGIEQYGKRYYYLAIHDENLTFNND